MQLRRQYETAGALSQYLVAALGPPPKSLVDRACPFDNTRHCITIYTAQKGPKRDPKRVGEYTMAVRHIASPAGPCLMVFFAQCVVVNDEDDEENGNDGRHRTRPQGPHCRPRTSTVPSERINLLIAGMEDVESTYPKKASPEEKIKIAITMGKAARAAWEATAGMRDEVSNDEPVAAPRLGKGKSRATHRVSPSPAPLIGKGKGKAKTAPRVRSPSPTEHVDEMDQYSALAFDTRNLPSRVVTLVFYHKEGSSPLLYVVLLRFLGCFQLDYFQVAKKVKAVGRQAVPYVRYSVYERVYTPADPAIPINMTTRGAYMIYKLASLSDAHCPGIDEWKTKAQASAAQFLPDSDSSDVEIIDDSDSESSSVIEISSDEEPGPSRRRVTGSKSAQATTSKLLNKRKRKPNGAADTEAGPSKRRR
ncbi:hypothetical protein R3P38DRAFT_2761426 [Favolaschia claudopus]|uniref:Uncharacterized protein n=1 Tax=Favolaschia claudopus TaxID=2862362 RepID=A0AAW0DQY2_9AGAR